MTDKTLLVKEIVDVLVSIGRKPEPTERQRLTDVLTRFDEAPLKLMHIDTQELYRMYNNPKPPTPQEMISLMDTIHRVNTTVEAMIGGAPNPSLDRQAKIEKIIKLISHLWDEKLLREMLAHKSDESIDLFLADPTTSVQVAEAVRGITRTEGFVVPENVTRH